MLDKAYHYYPRIFECFRNFAGIKVHRKSPRLLFWELGINVKYLKIKQSKKNLVTTVVISDPHYW